MEWSTIWAATSAIGAFAAALFAWRALFIAKSGLDMANETLTEAKRARKVTLAVNLSERYATDEMHRSLAYLGRRRDEYTGDSKKMAAAYVSEVVSNTKDTLTDWEQARRRVSKFFVSAAALCEAGLLEEVVLAKHLQRAAFDMCVDVVAVLDKAHSHEILKRIDYDPRIGSFFSQFRRRHFGDK